MIKKEQLLIEEVVEKIIEKIQKLEVKDNKVVRVVEKIEKAGAKIKS